MPCPNPTSTVAEIVAEDFRAARVFRKYRIDFCCHGDVTVPDACRDRGLDPDALLAELEADLRADDPAAEDPRALSTPALVARIVDRHHGYLRRQLPYLAPLVAKIAAVHGDRNPRLEELEALFGELAEALLPHLDREEEVLFPALVARRPDVEVVRRELEDMHADHLAVGDLLGQRLGGRHGLHHRLVHLFHLLAGRPDGLGEALPQRSLGIGDLELAPEQGEPVIGIPFYLADARLSRLFIQSTPDRISALLQLAFPPRWHSRLEAYPRLAASPFWPRSPWTCLSYSLFPRWDFRESSPSR